MLRFVLRLLALLLLAIACIFAIADTAYSVAEQRIVLTPLGQSLNENAPALIEATRQSLNASVPILWDPVLTNILLLPGSVLFAILALIAYILGHRRRRFAFQN